MIKIGQLLLDQNLISQEQLEIGLKAQKITSKRVGESLQSLDFVTSFEVAKALANQYNLEFIDLSSVVVEEKAVAFISEDDSKYYKLFSFELEDDTLHIATSNNDILGIQDFLSSKGISKYNLFFSDESLIKNLQHIYYDQASKPFNVQIESLIEQSLYDEHIDASNLSKLILQYAINLNATDIHISPDEVVSSIFFRIDGVMHMFFAHPNSLHKRVVSAIKVKSNMDIAKTNTPQDGAMRINYLSNEYDFRVSTIPTSHGENVVIRVLPKNSALFNLNNLGFNEYNQQKLERFFQKPYGIVLIVGPTGSGKTTTLYSALRHINSLEKNILTIEDPVEYSFSFIKQTQVNNQSGYTFNEALKYFMRQDPDVMLVGEIRDEETANLAIRASITGHLVLSTVHANTALDALPRLFDLKVDPAFLSLGLLSVVGQRLLRKLCPKCKEKLDISKKDIYEKLSFSQNIEDENVTIFQAHPHGCNACYHTGYKGRVAIIEIFEVDEEIKLMLAESRLISDITAKAKEKGMKTLKEDAIEKLFAGTTSIEEIKRVLN
jgi:type IV pilus assembly protein PilB